MLNASRVKTHRSLREAEGYLELAMPLHALGVLNGVLEPGTRRGRFMYLRGEAFRALKRYGDAIEALTEASDISPSDIHVWLAMGWCYKRSGRLDLAIEALQRAQEIEPGEALIDYNLACYWSLAENKQRALGHLSRALAIEPDYRDLIDAETDFDPLRGDPDFQSLTSMLA